MTRTIKSLGLGAALAMVALALLGGMAIGGASADDGVDLVDDDALVENVSEGDEIVVSVEFTNVTEVTIDYTANEQISLDWYDDEEEQWDNRTYNVGESIATEQLEPNELDGDSEWVESNYTLEHPDEPDNYTLQNPDEIDVLVTMTGDYSDQDIGDTDVSLESSGTGGFLGGDSQTQTIIILAVVLGGLYVLVRREVI